MTLTKPLQTIFDFARLTVNRYLGINVMGDKVEDIFNYLQLDDKIATGGQPTEKQMKAIAQAGYKTIINLALPTSENALADEKAVVESLEMNYIAIPIDFNHPTVAEFELFVASMKDLIAEKVFVHCAANLRVSAFMYLYRILYQNFSEAAAKEDLHKLWQPNPTWQNLIDRIIETKK